MIETLEQKIENPEVPVSKSILSDVNNINESIKAIQASIELGIAPKTQATDDQRLADLDNVFGLVSGLAGFNIMEIEYKNQTVIYKCCQIGRFRSKSQFIY